MKPVKHAGRFFHIYTIERVRDALDQQTFRSDFPLVLRQRQSQLLEHYRFPIADSQAASQRKK